MFVKDLVQGVFIWEASVYDVYELSSQVSFQVSVPWGIVPNDCSFVISVACWLWVVCKLGAAERPKGASSNIIRI